MRDNASRPQRFSKNKSRNGSGNGRRFSPKKSGFRNQEDIKVSRYIKKAVQTAVEDYVPKNQFSDFQISPELKKNILSRKFTTPTPIQDQAIPLILEGRDILGLANTGTGKTASFLIPLIDKVLRYQNEKVLIVAPTRELALQIIEELNLFTRALKISSVACIGGASIHRQMMGLRQKPTFVIGTPGRLKDLINRKYLDLSKYTNIVLDEVDRMLDMGFIVDIKELMSLLPEKRQSLFFSATVSRQADALIQQFLNNPVKISVKSGDTSDNVDQDVIKVKNNNEKISSLHSLLAKDEFKKVLIFGRTKRGVEDLSKGLKELGFKVGSIHGDKSQSKRERVLALFKADKIQTLVATDVAARGLDIADITHVINYDLPATYDDYVHRIGRTGRANKVGKALTFVN